MQESAPQLRIGHSVRSLESDLRMPRVRTVIDPSSYRAFHARGRDYFFDLATGTLAEINSFTRDLLDWCGQGDWESVEQRVRTTYGSWDATGAAGVVAELRAAGYLQHTGFNVPQQREFIDALWAHNPRRLQLLVAQMCNLKCLYCYEEHNGSNARRRLMTFEVAAASVDYLVRASGRRSDLQITFFGGEPLLNFKVVRKVVEYCRSIEQQHSKTFSFELITNATLLDPEVVEFIISQRFSLMISMDGYEEMHNHNRPSVSGKNLYPTILRNAKHAVSRYREELPSYPVKIRANLSHEHHDLIRTVRTLENEGFRTIGVSTVDSLPWAEGNLHACDESDLDSIEAQQQELVDIAINKMKTGKALSPYESKLMRGMLDDASSAGSTRGLKCGVGRNTNIVDCDGNIYPCHRYGDLKTYILGDIYSGLDKKRTMSYYRLVNKASVLGCETCWARNACAGPCAWLVSNPNGDVELPTADHCERIRRGLATALAVRHELKQIRPDLINGLEHCGKTCGCGQAATQEVSL